MIRLESASRRAVTIDQLRASQVILRISSDPGEVGLREISPLVSIPISTSVAAQTTVQTAAQPSWLQSALISEFDTFSEFETNARFRRHDENRRSRFG